MKQWFSTLLPREQRVVAAGAVAVVLIVFYAFVWEPLVTGRTQLQEDIARKTVLLEQGRRKQAQTPAAGSSSQSGRRTPTQSLTLLIANSANANGLANALRSSAPSANDGIRVSLENASFDALVAWLGQLGADNSVVVTAGNISDRPQPGRVDASIVLERR